MNKIAGLVLFKVCTFCFISTITQAQQANNDEIGFVQYRWSFNGQKINLFFNKEAYVSINVHSTSMMDLPAYQDKEFASKEDSIKEEKLLHVGLVLDSTNATRVYKNINENFYRIINHDDYQNLYCIIDSAIPSKQWQFISDTCTILGFKCNKAKHINTNTETVDYWYTTQIPLPFGPDKRDGLPGLVLATEGETSHVKLVAIKVQIPYTGNANISLPANIKIISKKDFGALLNKQNQEQMNIRQMYNQH